MKYPYLLLSMLLLTACDQSQNNLGTTPQDPPAPPIIMHGTRLVEVTEKWQITEYKDSTVEYEDGPYSYLTRYTWSKDNPTQLDTVFYNSYYIIYKYDDSGRISERISVYSNERITEKVTWQSDTVCIWDKFVPTYSNILADSKSVFYPDGRLKSTTSDYEGFSERYEYEWGGDDMVKITCYYEYNYEEYFADTAYIYFKYDDKTNAFLNAEYCLFGLVNRMSAHNPIEQTGDNNTVAFSYTYDGDRPVTCTQTSTSGDQWRRRISVSEYTFKYEDY